MKFILILFIQLVHILIILFAIFGCFAPLIYLKYHLFMFPIIYIQWKFTQKCIMTELEIFLDNTKKPLWTNIQNYLNSVSTFLSNDKITIVFLLLLITGFNISFLRLI